MIDNTIYLGILYDYYGELLTDKQKDFFESYYFENLTLQEIADMNQISKNAVHKTLVAIEEKLKYYEEKLAFYKKTEKIKECVKDETILKQILEIL